METVTLFESSVYADVQLDEETANTVAHNISKAIADVLSAAGVGSDFGVITGIYDTTDDGVTERKEYVRCQIATV